jgi:FAD/FMN-containing dehydrogenase
VWVGDPEKGMRYLETMRSIGTPQTEEVLTLSYLELQTIADGDTHGLRRYSTGHYLPELSDAAIEAFLSRGVDSADDVDWTTVAGGGLQQHGGVMNKVGIEESAFRHRDAVVEFVGVQTWSDPADDGARIASARAFGRAMAPFGRGVYVNVLSESDEEGVNRAYGANMTRLAELKRRYDPDNVFHLNQNIAPAS